MIQKIIKSSSDKSKIGLLLACLFLFSACTSPPPPSLPPSTPTITPSPIAKLSAHDNVCTQVSQDFVSQVTGVTIVRTISINDVSINACDYYLTADNNSPYIAIIVNKNLNFAEHRQIAQNNKLVLQTDPDISVEHYIAYTKDGTKISYIDLFLDPNYFLRLDKNVDRAVGDQGLLKLARAVSAKL